MKPNIKHPALKDSGKKQYCEHCIQRGRLLRKGNEAVLKMHLLDPVCRMSLLLINRALFRE
jgi:hypothetical protein